jgi:hypothetical protein
MAEATMHAGINILSARRHRPPASRLKRGGLHAGISSVKGFAHKCNPTLNYLKSPKKLSIP